jgi:hypothetical protein
MLYKKEGRIVEQKVNVQLEACIGCEASSKEHPIVGIGSNLDTGEKGSFPVCKECHENPQHRSRKLKMHFFSKANEKYALSKAFSTSIG